ncbi:hypothetical protein NTGBS_880002 [Candidatus Nitrotoga sp. BS]|nr:hypothetical protein NTGBS_880002 [Candidatus Nitrotoga sp. BS]
MGAGCGGGVDGGLAGISWLPSLSGATTADTADIVVGGLNRYGRDGNIRS